MARRSGLLASGAAVFADFPDVCNGPRVNATDVPVLELINRVDTLRCVKFLCRRHAGNFILASQRQTKLTPQD
jgi:hypothetical protein